jgi:hypothetical protein
VPSLLAAQLGAAVPGPYVGQQIHLDLERHLLQERYLGQITHRRVGLFLQIEIQLSVRKRILEGEPKSHVSEVALGRRTVWP